MTLWPLSKRLPKMTEENFKLENEILHITSFDEDNMSSIKELIEEAVKNKQQKKLLDF